MSEFAVVLTVVSAVAGLLILVFWVLPWLLEVDDELDESVPVAEILRRAEDERW